MPAAILLLLLSCCAAGARADPAMPDAQPFSQARFEIMPFAGYRVGGGFDIANSDEEADVADHGAFGLAFDVRRDEASSYEVLYSRQATRFEPDSPIGPLDVDVEYLHLGGTVDIPSGARVQPYFLGTLGATRFSVESGGEDTRFSVSLGAGFRVPVTPRFGVRLEARGFLTFLDTDSSVFCASGSFGGVCAIRSRGSTFTQFEVLAGAAFAF